ncbi:MAG TPA: hypothetical protein PL046_03155, partial [Polyangiaceae bacterium]|nr:hypothetical protein [Polyangiaceae bacterium]
LEPPVPPDVSEPDPPCSVLPPAEDEISPSFSAQPPSSPPAQATNKPKQTVAANENLKLLCEWETTGFIVFSLLDVGLS